MKHLTESFEVGDLENVLQNWIHVDEYKSKMSRDDKNCVISFTVDDKVAASDLVDFLERGYDFVLDADISNSEISINRYLVFMELARRTTMYEKIHKILSDLKAASGINPNQWKFKFMKDKEYQPFTKENFDNIVPLSPKEYRKRYQKPIDDLKTAAGLPVSTAPVEDQDLKQLQNLAGI